MHLFLSAPDDFVLKHTNMTKRTREGIAGTRAKIGANPKMGNGKNPRAADKTAITANTERSVVLVFIF